MKNFKLFLISSIPSYRWKTPEFLKKLLTFPRNHLKSNEFRYDCIYFARIFKKLFTFSTPKKRMPYALNEANFKKLFTFFVVLKSWKTQITNAVQKKNFYFLLENIQICRARTPLPEHLQRRRPGISGPRAVLRQRAGRARIFTSICSVFIIKLNISHS